MADCEDLIRYLVESLVDEPGSAKVTRVDNDSTTTYEISVATDDVGKIIGRQGRIIKALRTIARAAGAGENHSIDVEVIG